MTIHELNEYRERALSTVTAQIGVYALCDVDRTVIYVGQTVSTGERGIRGRSRRHISSARSDTIANRQIDVWEIAYLWAWPAKDSAKVSELEANLFNFYDQRSSLLNGRVLPKPETFARFAPPAPLETQLLPDEEIARRKDPRIRLPRQVQQIAQLLDWILVVKDTADLRRTLAVHFDRAKRHYKEFTDTQAPEISASSEEG